MSKGGLWVEDSSDLSPRPGWARTGGAFKYGMGARINFLLELSLAIWKEP